MGSTVEWRASDLSPSDSWMLDWVGQVPLVQNPNTWHDSNLIKQEWVSHFPDPLAMSTPQILSYFLGFSYFFSNWFVWLKCNGNKCVSSKFPLTELSFLITLSLAPGTFIERIPSGWSDSSSGHVGKKGSGPPLKTNWRIERLGLVTQAKHHFGLDS